MLVSPSVRALSRMRLFTRSTSRLAHFAAIFASVQSTDSVIKLVFLSSTTLRTVRSKYLIPSLTSGCFFGSEDFQRLAEASHLLAKKTGRRFCSSMNAAANSRDLRTAIGSADLLEATSLPA